MELYLRFLFVIVFLISVGLLIGYKDSIMAWLTDTPERIKTSLSSIPIKKHSNRKRFYFFPFVIALIGASIASGIFFLGRTFLLSTLASSKQSKSAPTKQTEILEVIKEIPWWIPETHWYFVGILTISTILVIVWRLWKKKFPEKEFLTLLFGIPAIHWLTWSIFPVFWVSWLTSGLFFPMHIAVLIAAWLEEKKAKGGLLKIAKGLIAVSIFLSVKDTLKAQSFPSFWKSKTSAVPTRVLTLNRNEIKTKLPSPPFLFWDGPEKQAVLEAFPNDTTMWNIAACESQFRQFRDSGELVVNPNSTATGTFQIMASTHEKKALAMGFDIKTPEGNIAYANYLRENEGYTPWEASSHCWRDGYPAGASGGVNNQPSQTPTSQSPLPAIDTRRVVAESTVVILPNGEFTNKFYPGRYAMTFNVENPQDSVYTLAEEVGSNRIHDAVLAYDRIQDWNFMVKSLRFRALNPSDTIRVWIRWHFKG